MALGSYRDESGNFEGPGIPGEGYRPTSSVQHRMDRARKYMAKMDPAIAGHHGHDSLWLAAQLAIKGFCLTRDEARPLLNEFNERCQPPWTDAELQHKVDDVLKNSRVPYGYIVCKDQPPMKRSLPQTWKYGSDSLADEDFELIPQPARTEVDEFPVDALSPLLKEFIKQVSGAMDCPPEFVGVPMLVIAGGMIGNARALMVKPGWMESGRIYAAVVASPGSAKTPAEKAVKNALAKIQNKAMARWKYDASVWDEAKGFYDGALKRGAKAESMPRNPGQRPSPPHYWTSDVTAEGLCPILESNPKGILSLTDELMAWLGGMNQYKTAGRDRQFWLSAWSGEAVKVDRKATFEKGSIIIPRPFVGVFGGIQPDVLSQLMEGGQDGLVDRILFAYPEDRPVALWHERSPSKEIQEVWERVLENLAALQMDERDGEEFPRQVQFTQHAKSVWIKWYDDHQMELMDKNFPDRLRGVWSKLRSYAARLALVVHFLRLAEFQITGELDDDEQDIMGEAVNQWSMAGAAALIDYFKSHLRRVYEALDEDNESKTITRILGYCRKRSKMSATVRDMLTWRLCKKSTEAKKLIINMADRGLVTIAWKDHEGGKVGGFVIPPDC